MAFNRFSFDFASGPAQKLFPTSVADRVNFWFDTRKTKLAATCQRLCFLYAFSSSTNEAVEMRKRRRKEIRNENLNARRWCGRYCGWNWIKIQVVTYSLVFEVVSVVANNFHVFWAVLLVWEIQNAQRWEREREWLLVLAIVWLRPCLVLQCMLIHSEFERIKSVSRDRSWQSWDT